MEGAQVGELVIVIFCICLYAAYLLWYFLLKGYTFSFSGKRGVVLWAVTKQNRALWTEAMMAVRLCLLAYFWLTAPNDELVQLGHLLDNTAY